MWLSHHLLLIILCFFDLSFEFVGDISLMLPRRDLGSNIGFYILLEEVLSLHLYKMSSSYCNGC
jgi:hypothetical protein